MTRFEKIQAHVPAGTQLPPELQAVRDWLDREGYPISGCMKIRPDDFGGLTAWFGGDETMARQFAYFGAGPDGSILAFWLTAGSNATCAPVVHLGSEGSHNKVLAEDFRSFLALFGIGYDELGFDDLNEPPEDPDSAAAFRTWLKAAFQIDCPETGAALVDAARIRCPDLQTCLDAWFKSRNGAAQ